MSLYKQETPNRSLTEGECETGQGYLSELLLIGPLVVLVGLMMRRWRLCAAGRSEGPWYSGHVMHRGAVRRQAGSLER